MLQQIKIGRVKWPLVPKSLHPWAKNVLTLPCALLTCVLAGKKWQGVQCNRNMRGCFCHCQKTLGELGEIYPKGKVKNDSDRMGPAGSETQGPNLGKISKTLQINIWTLTNDKKNI